MIADTIPIIHSMNWSDLSRNSRFILDEEVIEKTQYEIIKMNRAIKIIDQNKTDYLIGQLVYLDRFDASGDRAILEHWRKSQTYLHLYSKDPILDCVSGSSTCELFVIRSLETDELVGEIALQEIDWIGRKAVLGISIGRQDCWGKGYATDAVRILMRYAFHQLGLNRVTLNIR